MASEEFIAARTSALCEFYARCSDQIHGVYPADVGVGLAEGCVDFLGGDPALEALFARGHTKVNAEAAERCLEALRSCQSDGLCNASVGTLAEGEPCTSNHECSSGLCEGGSIASCGQCAPSAPAKLGEPCTESVGCEQAGEAFVGCFKGGESGRVCATVRTVAAGESCVAAGEVCEGDAYCHPEDGTCQLPVAVGQACRAGDRCARGALCSKAGADEGAGRTCIAVKLRTEGETCTDGFDLAEDGAFHVCDVTRDLRCDDATRTCTAVSRVGSGEACGGPKQCQEGLFCHELEQCAPLLTVGQSCRASTQCASQRCEGGVCVGAEIPVCE